VFVYFLFCIDTLTCSTVLITFDHPFLVYNVEVLVRVM